MNYNTVALHKMFSSLTPSMEHSDFVAIGLDVKKMYPIDTFRQAYAAEFAKVEEEFAHKLVIGFEARQRSMYDMKNPYIKTPFGSAFNDAYNAFLSLIPGNLLKFAKGIKFQTITTKNNRTHQTLVWARMSVVKANGKGSESRMVLAVVDDKPVHTMSQGEIKDALDGVTCNRVWSEAVYVKETMKFVDAEATKF